MIGRIIKLLLNWVTGKPSMLFTNVLLTHRCSQNCLQCTIPQQITVNEFMKFEDFKLILKRLIKQGTLGLTLSGGDPMLHPEIEKFIEYAHKKKFIRLHLLTTLYYDEKTMDKLLRILERYPISMSCSFDGFGEVADTLRGAKNVSETVEMNMRRINNHLRARGLKRKLGVNIVTSQKNLYQVIDVIKFIEKIGWRANLDIYRWRSENQNENDELKITDFTEFDKVIKYAIDSPAVWSHDWLIKGYRDYLEYSFVKICPYLLMPTVGSKFFINPDGKVEVCFGEPVGNLLEQEASEIFKSDKWQRKLEQFRQCKGCWNSCYTLSVGLFRFKHLRDILKAGKLIKS